MLERLHPSQGFLNIICILTFPRVQRPLEGWLLPPDPSSSSKATLQLSSPDPSLLFYPSSLFKISRDFIGPTWVMWHHLRPPPQFLPFAMHVSKAPRAVAQTSLRGASYTMATWKVQWEGKHQGTIEAALPPCCRAASLVLITQAQDSCELEQVIWHPGGCLPHRKILGAFF